MTKRILSLLLVAVLMFTTLAFELPVSVDAGELNSFSYGWCGKSDLFDNQLRYMTNDAANRCFRVTSSWNETEGSVRIKCDTSYGNTYSNAPYISIPVRFDGVKSATYNFVLIVYRYPTNSNSKGAYKPHLFISSTPEAANAGSSGPADWFDSSPNTSGGYTTEVTGSNNANGCSASFSYNYAIIDISSWNFSGQFFGELMYLPFGLDGKEGDVVFIDSIILCAQRSQAEKLGQVRSNPYSDKYESVKNERNGPEGGKYYVQNYRYAWYGVYEGFTYGTAPSSINVNEEGKPGSTGRETSPRASLNTSVTSALVSSDNLDSRNSLYTDEDTWTFTWSGLPTRNYYDFVGWYYYRYVAEGNLLEPHSEAGQQILKSFIPRTSNNNYSLTMEGVDDSHVEPRLYAAWTPTEYSITYNLNGGTNHPSNPSSYNYESSSYTLQNPTKTGYRFAGWTCNSSSYSTTIDNSYMGNRTYTANWIADNITVTWYDENGTSVLHTDTIIAGSTVPNYDGTTPTKAGGAQYSYTFSHWEPLSGVAVGGTANSSVAFKAVYTQTVNEYTVRFLNHDGTELQIKNYKYGETPAYNGTPVKAEDAGYTYQFSGWSPNVTTVTGTATYTALFTPVPKAFAITYDLAYGSVSGTNPSTYTIESDDITLINPTRPGYLFTGWSGTDIAGGTSNTVTIAKGSTGDRSYTATWVANNYTIYYNPGNGADQFTESYTTDVPHTLADAPVKKGHTFAGWMVSNVPDDTVGWTLNSTYSEVPLGAYGNVTLSANWTANFYSVKWVDGDGNVLRTDSVKYGEMPVPGDLAPTKAEDNYYTYVWTGGWNTELSPVEGEVTYTATFTPVPKAFNITYVYGNGSENKTVEYTVNSSALLESAPEKAGYTFDGWKADNGGNWGDSVYDAESSIDSGKYGNVTLTAQWTPVEYSITYIYDNGLDNTVFSYTVEDDITLNGAPIKDKHNFMGWKITTIDGNWADKTYEAGEALTAGLYGNVTFTAQWEIKKFTVTYVNEDGTVLQQFEDVVIDSSVPSYTEETPTKEPTTTETFTFIGWAPAYDENAVVSGDMIFTAAYRASERLYTIRWFAADGTTVLETDQLPYSDKTPSFDSEEPTKESTVQYDYRFAGWVASDGSPIENVIRDRDYFPQFVEVLRKYNVVWKNYDGTEIKTDRVSYGTIPEYEGETPEKAIDGYTSTFTGWDPEIVEVTGDAVYNALFSDVAIEYTLTYVFDGGAATNEGTYTTTYTIESIITLPSLEKTGFAFDGWTVSGEGKWAEISSIPSTTTGFERDIYFGNATLTAVWVEQFITITYEALENGSVDPASENVSLAGGVPNGSTATPDKDYRFVGWFADPECTQLVSDKEQFAPVNEGADRTYYAKFELAIADLVISVSGTQAIDENQSYIFDIVKPDSTTLTVAVYGDSSVTVKDVPVGSYTVSEKEGWSWRYVNENGGATQTVELTTTPDTEDESKANDNTAYFEQTRVEKPTEKALWLGGDSYKKNKYGVYTPKNDDPENDKNP